MRQVPSKASTDTLRGLPLGSRHDHFRARKRADSTCVVRVQVGEYYPANVRQPDTRSHKLRGSRVFRCELEPRQAEKRIPSREIAVVGGCRRLTRVNQTKAAGMFDKKDVDGEGLRAPVLREVPANAAPSALLPHPTG